MISQLISKRNIAYYIIAIFSFIFYWIAITQTGFGKSGDSVTHYLMAKNSWHNTAYFFNHWGKPFFTLLSSPFAQFGFTGIKVFNVTLGLLTAFITYKTAEHLNKPNAYISILTVLLSTYFVFKVFSGLTEYLSALMLISAIYLVLKNKNVLSACMVSFLPFVRSEGLIILGVFAVYFIVNKQYRALIWLPLGHIAYSIAGYFWYQDILWVFNKIPYATLSTIYGEGTWSHFFHQYINIVGVPIYILLIIGLLQFFYQLFRSSLTFKALTSVNTMLVYALFGAFFLAHMSFWALSIFNSMGLLRVFITVAPLTAIIALDGLNFLTKSLPYKWFQKSTFIVFVGYIIVFPFTSNPSAPRIPKDFQLEEKYVLLDEYITAHKNTIKSHKVFTSDPHTNLFLGLDMNDHVVSFPISEYKNPYYISKGDYIIWDRWYSNIEENISFDELSQSPSLQITKTIKINDELVFAIFVFQ